MRRSRSFIAALVTYAVAILPLAGQQPILTSNTSIAPVKPGGLFPFRDYRSVVVPPAGLNNTNRITSLIRGGKLYLTAQDAIALALENNIDLQIARYTPITDLWNLQRANAGGALPGVPSAQSQATSVARGEGVRGSQQAAGVSGGNNFGSGTNAVNATVTQIGPVTPTLDPVFQDTTTFSHLSSPQSNVSQSEVLNLIDNQRNYTANLQKGYLLGGTAVLSYNEAYLNENSPTDILNPQYSPTLQLQITQPWLQGFGIAVNSRTINIDKVNLQIDDLNFRTQVITVVVNVLNAYYSLAADYQDVKAKQSALDVANQFYANNKKQVEVGTLAPLDVTTAESQVASSQQALIDSQATLTEQQLTLKNLISRNGVADPQLQAVDIIPLDRIDVPEQDNLPPLKDLIATALNNRVDLKAEQMHLQVDELNALGTKNNVLPFLATQLIASNQGLAGQAHPVVAGPAAEFGGHVPPGFEYCPGSNKQTICELADPYFVGGIGTAVGQMFRRNYPTENATVYFQERIRNRQAQADYAIDQLSTRQDRLQTRKDFNQAAVDVSNQVVALQQARAKYLAAAKNLTLQQQLLDAEQKKFSLGASTPYNVVTQQRDLANAQSTETAALVAYSQARVSLQQTLGTTLNENHVNIHEAESGVVAKSSALPQDLPPAP